MVCCNSHCEASSDDVWLEPLMTCAWATSLTLAVCAGNNGDTECLNDDDDGEDAELNEDNEDDEDEDSIDGGGEDIKVSELCVAESVLRLAEQQSSNSTGNAG